MAGSSSSSLGSGMYWKILLVLVVGILAWAYQEIQPPPNKVPGSPDGPPITGPRIKLRDGRHLSYKQRGVPKDVANYNVIFLHPFTSCSHDPVVDSSLSEELIEELGIHIVNFDRPGHGESDPHPSRTLKSLSLDIEELADQLGLGSKFYLIGYSMGGTFTWSCLKYIPHRLAGVSLLSPAINHWWPGFPANLSTDAFNELVAQDRWAYRVNFYVSWLLYWWNSQKWFPGYSVLANTFVLSKQDRKIAPHIKISKPGHATQQGNAESVIRDLAIAFGNWEFDPMDMENPFPNGNEGFVHLWQGDEDGAVPVTLQRYIVKRLPWIRYHELAGSGHMYPFLDGMFDKIVRIMLIGE